MAKHYPPQFRKAVIDCIKSGQSCRGAAKIFGIAPSTAVRWYRRYVREGKIEGRKVGGDRRSAYAQSLFEFIICWVLERPDRTIAEICALLAEWGHSLSEGAVRRLLAREGYTRKKMTTLASERKRADVREKRSEWEHLMDWLAGYRLIFLDEFSITTKMARVYGRSRRGKRSCRHVPYGHWKTLTVVAAMSEDGIIAHKCFDGPMTGERFCEWLNELTEFLCPEDIVICDNLAAHKVAGAHKIVRKADACLCFLPPYSPDRNPIEMAISQMKSFLRKVAASCLVTLQDSMEEAVKLVTGEHARNYFRASGYLPTQWGLIPDL